MKRPGEFVMFKGFGASAVAIALSLGVAACSPANEPPAEQETSSGLEETAVENTATTESETPTNLNDVDSREPVALVAEQVVNDAPTSDAPIEAETALIDPPAEAVEEAEPSAPETIEPETPVEPEAAPEPAETDVIEPPAPATEEPAPEPTQVEESDRPVETAEEQSGSLEDRAVDFVQTLVSNAFAIFNDPNLSETDRDTAFQVVLSDGLAIDYLGRIMLGRHRETATPEQTAEYDRIFPPYITQLYAEQIGRITKNELEVVDSVARGERDVFVRTLLQRANDNAPILVVWRARQTSSGDIRIIDIIVKSISIMSVKRDEFSSLIENEGLDSLLAEMREKAEG